MDVYFSLSVSGSGNFYRRHFINTAGIVPSKSYYWQLTPTKYDNLYRATDNLNHCISIHEVKSKDHQPKITL